LCSVPRGAPAPSSPAGRRDVGGPGTLRVRPPPTSRACARGLSGRSPDCRDGGAARDAPASPPLRRPADKQAPKAPNRLSEQEDRPPKAVDAFEVRGAVGG